MKRHERNLFAIWLLIPLSIALAAIITRDASPVPDGYVCAPIDNSDGIWRCWNPDLEHNGG